MKAYISLYERCQSEIIECHLNLCKQKELLEEEIGRYKITVTLNLLEKRRRELKGNKDFQEIKQKQPIDAFEVYA